MVKKEFQPFSISNYNRSRSSSPFTRDIYNNVQHLTMLEEHPKSSETFFELNIYKTRFCEIERIYVYI